MPVLVVGADTVQGAAIAGALEQRPWEKRAFVTDPQAAEALRDKSWKVAVGDVSDGSHVAGAALGCFTAVLIPEAAFDARERSFARSPAATLGVWVDALSEAGLQRVIWLEDGRVVDADAGPQVVVVGRRRDAVAALAVVAGCGQQPRERQVECEQEAERDREQRQARMSFEAAARGHPGRIAR